MAGLYIIRHTNKPFTVEDVSCDVHVRLRNPAARLAGWSAYQPAKIKVATGVNVSCSTPLLIAATSGSNRMTALGICRILTASHNMYFHTPYSNSPEFAVVVYTVCFPDRSIHNQPIVSLS